MFRSAVTLLVLAVALTQTVSGQNCNAFGVCRNQECPIDSVCFAIDQSGSLRGQYPQVVQFVKSIAASLDSRATNPIFSAVGFSDGATVIERGTRDLAEFNTAVDNSNPPFQGTNIQQGLSECFSLIENDVGVSAIVLITDGVSSAGSDPIPTADSIKATGDTFIITVGIGGSVDEDVLKEIASGPEFFIPSEIADLPGAVSTVVDGTCTITTGTSCMQAFDKCDFRFENTQGLPVFDISVPPEKPFTPRIISRVPGEIPGILNTNNIVPEFIFNDGSISPITDFGSQRFTPTHFKPFRVPGTTGSGIRHQTFHGDQLQVAKDKCIRIFFTSYQLLFPNTGFVMSNLNDVKRVANKCVVFRTLP